MFETIYLVYACGNSAIKMSKKILLIFVFIIFVIFSIVAFIFLYYNRPPYRSLIIDPLYHFETQEKIVALTFDDGPSETWTPLLLDLLEKYEVKATFFMIGENIEKFPDVAKSVYEKGHEIGSHSYNHKRMIFKTPGFIRSDLEKTDRIIKDLGVSEVKSYRPPYGDKMILLPLELKKQGKTLVTFDVQAMSEYQRENQDSSMISREILDQIEPGSIIVMHDGRGYNSTTFLKAVEEIIVELKTEGYRFVKVQEGISL